MRKIILNLAGILVLASALAQNTLNPDERKRAIAHLKETENNLVSLTRGLSEQQLNFKEDDTAWSIAECVEHIAISEKNLIGMIQMSLKEDSDPSKRSEVQMTDDQILGLIESREQKVKTRTEFEPTNSFGSYAETMKTFRERRKANLQFVKSTREDLRNHYLQFPFGLIDSYQGILFMSGHTRRHTDQIKEIMSSEGFPN
ncbi:DinB family protein [Ekhidna sp.]|uniref:DinB family protein n=1 Tax=Ekhidna sp. TaxID=2608089 RepID=UPI003513B69C